MKPRLVLPLFCLLLSAVSDRAHSGEERFIVVTETHNLDAALNNPDDGPGTISGTHVMRYKAPSAKELASLPVGGTLMIKRHDITGSSTVRAKKDYYDGATRQSRSCPGSYQANGAIDRGGSGLFVKRTAAGFEFGTFPYAEFWVSPWEACAGVAHGSCAFVFETMMTFRVSLADVEKLDQLRVSYQGHGDWNEGEARMCNGTVRATLSGDLVPEEGISVDGPSCACATRPLTLTASVKAGGGSFEKWDVQASGEAPSVVDNLGGTTAKLTLTGDGKKTGAARVTAVYRKQGKLIRSETRTVHFCRVEKPELQSNDYGSDKHDYRFQGGYPGRVEIPAEGKAWLDGQDASERLKWDTVPNPGGLLRPDPAQAKKVKLTATALPASNDDFGPRSIRSRIDDSGCACQSEAVEARLFFARDDHNNPTGDLPNWAYYWKQTPARPAGGDFRVVPAIPPMSRTLNANWGVNCIPGIFDDTVPGNAIGRYDFFADMIYLSETFATADACPARADGAKKVDFGIDCFAVVLRHEGQHQKDFNAWWGPRMTNYRCLNDTDGDLVPNDVEKRLGCNPLSRQSCPNLPRWLDSSVTDREASGYSAGWQWRTGCAKDKDWAAPGSQWNKQPETLQPCEADPKRGGLVPDGSRLRRSRASRAEPGRDGRNDGGQRR
jgi:hypothetical protein